MKTIKIISYALLILFASMAISSCKGPEGPQGPPGKDGTDGVNGTDGVDGNANVQTYIFNNPTWDGSYWMDLHLPTGVLTQEVIENDVILGYVKPRTYVVNPIPGLIASSPMKNIRVNLFTNHNYYRIVCYNQDGSIPTSSQLPPLDWAKVIIIESTNTTTANGNSRGVSPYQAVLNELKAAGVDINNYYDVCAYYGINP